MKGLRSSHFNNKFSLPLSLQIVKCVNCGKEIPEDHIVYCDMCGVPLCEECGNLGLCSICAELWEAEIDLEDMEVEEE